eukprot:TRINITY_DN24291_c0_g1_i1.p1 TRINITY_DN24291_c0_g1~~TRINITY_DN24291_c0_g1_i1.p1  ORF type:complete len:522 (+),score=116.76 TRINITY_DN24291_c0_g1_i1:145-1566(+)
MSAAAAPRPAADLRADAAASGRERVLWLRGSMLGEPNVLRGTLRLCGSDAQSGESYFVADGTTYVGRAVGQWQSSPRGGLEVTMKLFQYNAMSREPAPTELQRLRLRSTVADNRGVIEYLPQGGDSVSEGVEVGSWQVDDAVPPAPRDRLPPLQVKLPPQSAQPLVKALKTAATAATLPGALGGAMRKVGVSKSRVASLAAKYGMNGVHRVSHNPIAATAARKRPKPGPEHVIGAGVLSKVQYVPEWLSTEEEAELLREAYSCPEHKWAQITPYRRTQEFGEVGRVCGCNRSMLLGPLPDHLQRVADELHVQEIFDPLLFPLNSIRANRYDGPGTGIYPHADGPIYFPRVALLSLGSPVVFSFWPTQGDEDSIEWDESHAVPVGGNPSKRPLMSVALMPRSLLLFEGDAFNLHRHGVVYAAEDVVDELVLNADVAGLKRGDRIVRKKRVGLTLRHLLPRCCCQPIDPHAALRQ